MKRIAVVGVPGAWSSDHLAATVAAKAGDCLFIDMDRATVDVGSGRFRLGGEALPPPDAVIVKKIGREYAADQLDRLEMLRLVEDSGVPFFSSPAKILRLFNRVSGTAALRAAGVPMPPTVISTDPDEAAAALAEFGRGVLKPIYSTKGRGMRLVDHGPDARAELAAFQAAGNPVIYLQKALKLPGYDLGVSFLGGEYLATYARVAGEGAWNTTIHSGGKYRKHEPSAAVMEVARKARAAFGLEFTGVDVVETDDGPLVFEVSAFGGYRGLREAHGIDAAALLVDAVLRRVGVA